VTRQLLLMASLSMPVVAALAQGIQVPKNISAGSAFTIATSGSGDAVLYLIGQGQALRRDVKLDRGASFAAGDVYAAGHYMVLLVQGASTDVGELDVLPSPNPGSLGFLAKPSRLPVNVHNGISGAVYVFDPYHNVITAPMSVSLELSSSSGTPQTRTVATHLGLAWTTMDSSSKESSARLTARAGSISSTRIIAQVPGDPCSLSITAKLNGSKLQVQTAPVRDCSGNAIPDGTIVTFTETFNDAQSTVDVPLKQGIASAQMPANRGAKISAASGVVAGNEIRWEGGGQ